jgi:hypothetical protein
MKDLLSGGAAVGKKPSESSTQGDIVLCCCGCNQELSTDEAHLICSVTRYPYHPDCRLPAIDCVESKSCVACKINFPAC